MIDTLCIIGVGLIGGSLARALREAGRVGEIVGYGRDPQHLQRARDLGVIDRYETDPARALADADVVLVAAPVGAMGGIFQTIAPHLPPQAILTDAGSTKGSVVAAAATAFGTIPARFVPGHPIAGTEKSGAEAAFAQLYQGRRVILTPMEHTDPEALAVVRAMWESAGGEVVEMEVAHHDEVLAATSHLPHLLAFTMVDTLARMEEHTEIFRYAAGGFRDFTRIASSDPQMWHDICLNNREALLKVLARYSEDMAQLARAIAAGDSATVLDTFRRAKTSRDEFCNT